MVGSANPQSKSPCPRRVKLTYRGVTLQTPAAAPRFPIEQIKKAVEDALAKHAAALGGGD